MPDVLEDPAGEGPSTAMQPEDEDLNEDDLNE